MNNENLYIKPNSTIVNLLKDVEFPITSIKDITGYDTKSLLILIDDGPAKGKYQTFGYFIADWNYSANLVNALKKIKQKYNISERKISYKGRKDKLKRNAFQEWINIVRNYSGLLYVTAFDNSAKTTKEFRKDYEDVKNSLDKHGFQGGFEAYEKMAKVLSFLSVISSYFYSDLNIILFSDPDTIIDTKQKVNVINYSLRIMLKELVPFKLGHVNCMTKFNERNGSFDERNENKLLNHAIEELLSIPDIACSSISSMLNLTSKSDISCPDDETSEIITEIAKFTNIEDYKKDDKSICTFGLSVFDIKYTEDGLAYYVHRNDKFIKTKPNNASNAK
ncbi:MAG TPA: hypothetical protein DCG75_01905 [Bacteroidales bacterium]|nr:hypothetical protein [Bacteroidales bacterium]